METISPYHIGKVNTREKVSELLDTIETAATRINYVGTPYQKPLNPNFTRDIFQSFTYENNNAKFVDKTFV